MKKSITTLKNFVQDINLSSRGEKTDVLTIDLLNAEKRVEMIKQACQSTEKKVAICLQGAGTGIDALSIDKRSKKMPEVHLYQCFQEFSEQLGSDSVLGQTLSESGDIQKNMAKELLHHELEIEKECLLPLNGLLENDIPNVTKSRKHLNKATQDMDSYRQRYQTALKQSHQNSGPSATVAAANKAEALKKEWEEATTKVEQAKDVFAAEMFSLLSREPEFSHVFLRYFKLQANYHRKALDLLEASVPRLEKVILNSSQKPIFGTPLEEHLRVTNREIAVVIETCIGWLLLNIHEEGLFRIPGSTSKVKKLKSSFDAMIIDVEEYVRDPHTVCGTLKSYLRELPEPLLTYALYPEWIEAAKVNDSSLRLQAFWQVLAKLPKAYADNLQYLVKFLAKLSLNSDSNKMSSQNIAISLAPSLVWAPNVDQEEVSIGLNMTAANLHSVIIDSLVNYADWFFPGDIEFKTLPVFSYYEKTTNGDMERSSSFNANDSLNSNVVVPRTVQRPAKKPAPPAPSTPNSYTNGKASGASLADKNLERRGSLNNHLNTNGNGNTISNNNAANLATLPRNSGKVSKPERPSIRNHTFSGIDSSSNEAVDSVINKSPIPYATGSLDRMHVRGDDKLLKAVAGDRKSIACIGTSTSTFRSKGLVEKPCVPPPSVPQLSPAPVSRTERPSSLIERPSVPPPERPQRSIDQMRSKQQSLESLTEDSAVSPSKLYPDLTPLAKEDEPPIGVNDVSLDLNVNMNGSGNVKNGHNLPNNRNNNNNNIGDPGVEKDCIAFVDDSDEDFVILRKDSQGGHRPPKPQLQPKLHQHLNHLLEHQVQQQSLEAHLEPELEKEPEKTAVTPTEPPEKPPRSSPPLRMFQQNNHSQDDPLVSRSSCSSPAIGSKVANDSELVPESPGRARPPRPLPPAPATKPRIASLQDASHL